MSDEPIGPEEMKQILSRNTEKSKTESGVELQTYNSAADLTEHQAILLEKNEYLFDIQTKNSCVRPLENFIKLLSKSNTQREFTSYTSLSLTRPRTVDAFFDHVNLNKYSEVVVYEQTRVRAPHQHGHNYINATWLDGFREKRKFIVAQSPLKSSVGQFYRMMFERKSYVMVVLCELVDETNQPYVPQKIGDVLKFEEMTIEMLAIRQITATYYASTLKMTKEGQEPRQIILLIYHGWGVSGYPRHPSEVLKILADMNNMRGILRKKAIEENVVEDKQDFPVTLVCFDGLSRSCAIAALDILCRRLEHSMAIGTPFVDVLDTIARLRMLRAEACSKAEHYVFLSMAILEFGIRRRIITREMLMDIDLSGFILAGE